MVDHDRNLLDPETALLERPSAIRSGVSGSCGVSAVAAALLRGGRGVHRFEDEVEQPGGLAGIGVVSGGQGDADHEPDQVVR